MADDMFCVELDKHLQDSDDEQNSQEDKVIYENDEQDPVNETDSEGSEYHSSDDDSESENDKGLNKKYRNVTYSVTCEYRVEPVKSKSRRQVTFNRSKDFKKTFNSTSTDRRGKASCGFGSLFSFSAGFATARKRIAEATFDNETETKEEIAESVEFFDNHKQVYRVVKQTMNIDGEDATIETRDLVDATEKSLGWDERKERAIKVRSKTRTGKYLFFC